MRQRVWSLHLYCYLSLALILGPSRVVTVHPVEKEEQPSTAVYRLSAHSKKRTHVTPVHCVAEAEWTTAGPFVNFVKTVERKTSFLGS